jgi:hypothetical protein
MTASNAAAHHGLPRDAAASAPRPDFEFNADRTWWLSLWIGLSG